MIADRELLRKPMQKVNGSDQPICSTLAIDNGHTFEEIFQLDDVLFDC